MGTSRRLTPHLPRIQTVIFSSKPSLHSPSTTLPLPPLQHVRLRLVSPPPWRIRTHTFGTPFFALINDPETEGPELGKLEVGGRLRQELAAWERVQHARKLKAIMDNKRAKQIAEDAATTGHRVHRRGSTNFFEFVDRDDERPAAATATTEQWPDVHIAATADLEAGDIDRDVDGFVLIHRDHVTGSVSRNQRSHSTRSSRHGVRAHSRRHHRKYQLELELADDELEEGEVDIWAAFMDLLRPVSEMDW